MRSISGILFALFCFLVSAERQDRQSYIHKHHTEVKSVVKTHLPRLRPHQIPKNFTWSNIHGQSYLTVVKNHHIPNYCGGCYAFASTSTLSDRIKIARKAQFPDILISPQMVVSCTPNRGCHGGSPLVVYQYIHEFGITDETCSPYRARGHENGAPCTDEIKCSTCDEDGNCYVPESYPVYYAEEFGRVRGEYNMMNEIYQRGPIACSIDSSYIDDYTGGIVNVTAAKWVYDHVISIVGFGEENGIPYWHVRNSWGSFWGDQGFFKVYRGNNTLGIEGSCSWVVPKDTWTKNVRNHTKTQKPDTSSFFDALMGSKRGCVKFDPKYERLPSKSGSRPWDHIAVQAIPKAWDWRNVSGINYVSMSRVQNAPHSCASCWAEAATSALADRIMISRNSTFPEIALSVQALINCQSGGDCGGGDPMGVFEFAYTHGIPEESCQNYLAKNPDSFDCSPIQLCKNCGLPAPFPNGTDPANCEAITDYNKWKVEDYGTVSGVENMKKAIYTGGPIACGIQTARKLEQYKGGIFSQKFSGPTINHQVSIVGWGEEHGVGYWIVRNSWGVHWGELGFFRIKMGEDNLGIENECIWGTPVLDNGKKKEEVVTI